MAAKPSMKTGVSTRPVAGTFERRDGIGEIEAGDMGALEALVPDGWQLLFVSRS